MDIGAIYNGFRDTIAAPLTLLLVLLHDQLANAGFVSWGLTIIVFTVLVKLLFWPLTMQQMKASKAMQSLQPQLAELKKTHGKDKEKMMQEQMRLYKENRVNPMAGCLPMLIQLPIWIGLYQALYKLVLRPDFADKFLGIWNLATPEPNINTVPFGIPILAILTALSQFAVQRMMQVNVTDPQQKSMNQAMQFMPIMYLFISAQMPAGLVLYWVASNAFTMIQQSFYTGWKGVVPAGLIPRFGAPAPAVVAVRSRTEPIVVVPAQLKGPGDTNGALLGRSELAATTVTPPPARRTKKRRK